MKHGRYSTLKSQTLRDLIEEHEADPDPLNILPELAAGRAIFQDFIERYTENRDALLAWHESYRPAGKPVGQDAVQALSSIVEEFEGLLLDREEMTPGYEANIATARRALASLGTGEEGSAKPREVLDISDAMRHLDTISRMVRRDQQSRSDQHISRVDFLRTLTQMGRVVAAHNHIADPVERLERIENGWAGIVV